ncbi:MAG: IS630 family transposase [Actinomycetota bacterium]|nr:IS630 family transposase [Actinomycetota bacterium]
MSLSEHDRNELHAALRSEGYDGSVSSRAQIVLWYDEGHRKGEIAAMSRPTVDKWLKRYKKFGMDGLVSRTSPGGPRQIPDRIRARVLALTRTTPPAALGISHWSSAEMARYIKKTEGVYVSQTWVSRLWRENGLAPWRQGTFKISEDPRFEEKVRDVVGLYLNPPAGEVVVSVDANTGIQALDRTQPLPIDFGKTQKRTFDYARRGTTDLYAAMDVRTGKVITSLAQTHATPDFLRLMKKVVAAYPGQKVHVVLDNASVHLSKETEEWLATQRGRVVFHFTPTGASWMNQIEIWNGIITRKLIRCGTFSSVKVLNKAIQSFVEHWNSDCAPITWTATADEIIDKVRTVTSRMEALLRATEIDDVARQAA